MASPKLFIVPLQLHVFVFWAVLFLAVVSLSLLNQNAMWRYFLVICLIYNARKPPSFHGKRLLSSVTQMLLVFMWSSFVSNSCLIIMKTEFYKNRNDYSLYISDPTFHDYFSLNCFVETETGTMATGRASDSALDKPLSDERREILKRVKRDFARYGYGCKRSFTKWAWKHLNSLPLAWEAGSI